MRVSSFEYDKHIARTMPGRKWLDMVARQITGRHFGDIFRKFPAAAAFLTNL
jgi:hypothetical protein